MSERTQAARNIIAVQAALKDSEEENVPVDLVRCLVKLSETFGYTLPWANLLEACAGVEGPTRLSWAVQDLKNAGEIEITAKGLRFALDEPPAPKKGDDD